MQHIKDMIARITPTNGATKPAERKPAYSPPERATLHQLDDKVHPFVAVAIQSARKWQTRRREFSNASMVLVASQSYLDDAKTIPDMNCTGYGCGKTHIARAILWSICLWDGDVPVAPVGKFHTAANLLELVSEGGEHEVAALLGTAPILVIDDVGSEGELPFVSATRQGNEKQARYFRIIDYCYRKGIAVIVTSNLSFPALAGHMGGRCWSRLMEMAPTGFMLDLTGVPDYRRANSGR